MGILRASVLASLAAAALVLTACSDDDGPSDTSDSAGSTERSATVETAPVALAEGVVTAFYEEFAAGEYDAACARWTRDYVRSSVETWNDNDFGKQVSDCPGLLAEIVEVFTIVGKPEELLVVTGVAGELTGDTTATVDVTLASDPDETETYELTQIDGAWLISGDESGELASTDEPSPTSSTSSTEE
ncbi:hypothetical protein D0Z08_09725 [Nocardioides immobilis]|uniref:Nuclear transport factor 2 family protein n=1 Tax=Nocardioides immobilis TaxID=2049295 RepID=A0A417Y4A6_9ACTN|nr:hypothetical protein [Nocardioides immobilis]RHW27417.1 hypothetical protein D0Z08_09725 [Nocardioides immobilis]